MSKIALVSPASGTATFSITTPSGTSTDRTLNLPDAGGTVVSDTAAQTLTNKTFSGAQVFGTASLAEPTGTAPLYMCRAWVNFDGTTATPSTIRGSGNVSSVTKNSTGNYTVNFTTAMPDANYSVVSSSTISLANAGVSVAPFTTVPTTTAVRIQAAQLNPIALADALYVSVAIFR